MRTLKKSIWSYMYKVTFALVSVILISITALNIANEQSRAQGTADKIFEQMDKMLEENQKELTRLRQEYAAKCLHNTEAIAYILEKNTGARNDLYELRKIAEFMEVDEIHIIDAAGEIVSGTHPQYYGYSFDSGEQMNYFKPMLKDKSLKMVQDIEPNTAEHKLMQYSAMWNSTGEFIVEAGIEPVNVSKVTEKNELPYIFSQLCVNPDTSYFAVNAETEKIVGATDTELVGMDMKEIGLNTEKIHSTKGFSGMINGKRSYIVFKKVADNYIGVAVTSKALYERIPLNMLYLAVCLVLIALALFKAVTRYLDREVVQKIGEVNGKLHKITMGDLNVKIDVHSSREFFELSRYINEMLQSLLVNDRKMRYVLGKTDMHIGVYEYNRQMKRVRFTGDVLQILKTGTEAAWKLPSDWEDFKKYIRTMQKEPVAGENEIFAVGNGKYLKIEEIQEGEEIFGVITDVTEEIRKRREIEYQRDHDQLTGLFNRTGRDTRLSKILEECREPYYCAAVMVDADGLKMVNDTYGHENGDEYLKRIAEMLKQEAGENSILCRQGGDEFTLFYYKYGKEALVQKIEALKALQSGQKVRLRDGLTVDLRFSMGSSMAYGAVDYDKMYREADEKMYEDKRMRKKLAEETNTIES